MSKEYIFLFLLVSVFVAAIVLSFVSLRYHFQLRHARRLLKVSEKRRGLYLRRLMDMRRGHIDDRVRAGEPAAEFAVGETAEGDSSDNELRLRLQRGQQNTSGIVERYRLVGNMARRGLSAEDISAILQLPHGETEQLLKLAQVGRR